MNKTAAFFSAFLFSAAALFAAPDKPQGTPPLRTPLTGWQTWPSTGERTLPDTPLPAGRTNAVINLVAARGVTASATFAVRASAPVASLELSADCGEGLEIDLRVVKCWYQDANAWFSGLRGMGGPVLVPELLLHDASLVKTDSATKTNLVRLDGTGDYAPVADGITVADDAPALKPVALQANETCEFFLSVVIPADTPAALRHGRIAVKGDGKELGFFTLDLRIIDYVLPAPTGRFLGNKYTDGKKVISGSSPAPLKDDSYEPYAAAAALPSSALTKENCAYLVRCGLAPVLPYAAAKEATAKYGLASDGPLWLADALDGDGTALAAPLATVAKDALAAGFSDVKVFVPGSGEAFLKTLDEVDAAGAKSWAFADEQTFRAAADVLAAPMRKGLPIENHVRPRPMMGSPYGNTEYSDTRQIERWHAIGTPDYLYIDTEAGIENPGFWRRRLGLECYTLGYDGFILPRLIEEKAPWTDASSPALRSRTFLYPTKNGLIPTLAWAGVCDAVLDARYLSAVSRLAVEARYAQDVDVKIAIEGRKAASWLDWLRQKLEDPDTIRLESIAWIDKLDTVLRKHVTNKAMK